MPEPRYGVRLKRREQADLNVGRRTHVKRDTIANEQLPVRLVDEPRDLDRAWDLSRRYDNHPIYDMLYVAVAERHRTQFVTADAGMRALLRRFDWVLAPQELHR